MTISPASEADAGQIAGIYNHYITTSHATFELDEISAGEMIDRLRDVRASGYPFLVYKVGSEIIGYAYRHKYRPRPAYRHAIEVSVYVKPGNEGRSIGTALYASLLTEITKADFHAVLAGISLPNDPSIRLHEKFGFQKVAHFHEVGFKFDRWIDVGYWELIISK